MNMTTLRNIILAIGLTGLCSCATRAPHGLPNFSTVEPGIYRGGQPTVEGWKYLKSIGVKTVIKLNQGTDDWAMTNGMRIISRPISFWEQTFGQPDRSALDTAISSISGEGTYIHCAHGWDRTGLMVGEFRVRKEKWPKEKAYAEMLEHNFHPILRGLYRTWEETTENEK